MPIYDNDGTSSREIGKLYDNNGSTNSQIKEVYDHNGTTSSLIYKDLEPIQKTLSVTGIQDGAWHDSTWYYIPSGYVTVRVDSFTAGTSYGTCVTKVRIIRNGVEVAFLRHTSRSYTGTGFTYQEVITPQNTYPVVAGDHISIVINANYDPNVSGQHSSTSSVTFTVIPG